MNHCGLYTLKSRKKKNDKFKECDFFLSPNKFPIFANKLDFLSIGTNDLIQYTMAIDRINDEVNYLYDPLHPAVLRLIQTTIIAGQKENIPISMCGEMAGEKEHTQLLLGLGLREFSVHPATLLEVKEIINKTNISELSELTKKALM